LLRWRQWCLGQALIDLIEHHHPKASKKGGRPPYLLTTILRIHLLQRWCSLSDPAMEETLIEVPTMRRFAGIELISDWIPDETTIPTLGSLLRQSAADGGHEWAVHRGSCSMGQQQGGRRCVRSVDQPQRGWSSRGRRLIFAAARHSSSSAPPTGTRRICLRPSLISNSSPGSKSSMAV
jgi:hypothetical protein